MNICPYSSVYLKTRNPYKVVKTPYLMLFNIIIRIRRVDKKTKEEPFKQ